MPPLKAVSGNRWVVNGVFSLHSSPKAAFPPCAGRGRAYITDVPAAYRNEQYNLFRKKISKNEFLEAPYVSKVSFFGG